LNRKILGLIATLGLVAATSATAQSVKWHPGHYLMLNGYDSLSTHYKHIDEIGKVGAIRGVMVRIWWYELEPYMGVYNFSKIDALIKRLQAQPSRKQLVVRVMDRRFNTSSKGGIVPDYLRTSTYNWGLVQTHSGYAARLWEKPVMDRYINLLRAIGYRYNGNKYFEGVSTEETTLAIKYPPSGYSDWALATQWQRMVKYVKPSMANSNLFLFANWIGKSYLMENLVNGLYGAQGAGGGSNIIPGKLTLAQMVYTGKYGTDYRGILPLGSGVETDVLGGTHGWYTPKQIGDFAYNALKLNHVFWVRNTWSGGSAQRWNTGILPYLKSNPPIHKNCPARYASCNWY
jgi:hypothetical protein